MKTKFLPMLLSIVLLTALTACGIFTTPNSSGSGRIPDEGNALENVPDDDPSEQSAGLLGRFSENATLAETVLVDEGGVKITATGLTYTGSSADLAVTIENSSGKDMSFFSNTLGYSCNSINGYMVDEGYLNCDVANGKKANDTIRFGYETLMLYGIDEIADMEIGIGMSDDDYNHTYFGPRQLKTSAFDVHDYETDHYQVAITSDAAGSAYGYEMVYFSLDALYDHNGVKLRSSGVIRNRDGEIALLLELENTTDRMMYVSTSDIAVNGLGMTSSTWSNDAVNAGKRRIVELMLSSILDTARWSAYGLTEVGTVSLSLSQYSVDGAELASEIPVEIVIPGTKSTFDGDGTEVYNHDGLRLIAKAVQEDASDSSADLYILLLAENRSGKTLTIDDVYNSLSVNGFMTDYSFSSQELANGASAALVIRLLESSLVENQISSAAEVQEIELSFEIQEENTTIDEPTVTLAFG